MEVTEANKQHKAKLPLKLDGMQSRYEKRSPSTGHPIGDSFCPQPLQPRSRTLAGTDDTGEGLVEALKASEPIAILQEQHLLELEKQKAIQDAIQEAIEQEKQKKGVIGTLKRKVSSTFQKDTTEQHKSEDLLTSIPLQSLTPSPSQSSINTFRKPSSSKATYRGEILPTISENDAPPDRSTITSNISSLHPNEQAAGISPRDSGYSGGGLTTPSPQAKSLIPKPSLTINASKANNHALSSRHVSPALGGTRNGSQSAVGSRIDLPLTNRKSSGNANQARRRFATMSSPVLPDTPMKKREKFKPNDPRVKMVERAILREEFGVNTTPQLTSEYRIVLPAPKEVPQVVHSNSWYHARPESNPVSTVGTMHIPHFQDHHHEPATSNADSCFQFNREETATSYPLSSFQFDPEDSEEPAKNVGAVEPVVHDSVHPHYSFESTASDNNTYISQGSTFPSSEIRASADTIQSFTVPQTPDTPSTGISSGVTRKDFGTHGGAIMSPLQPVGRPVWCSSTNSFGEDVTNSARSSTGRVAGRSLTDPFDISAIDNTKNGGIGDKSEHKGSHSPEFSNVAPFKPEPLNLGKSSDQTVNDSTASLARGIQVLDFGTMDDRTMSPVSPADTVISGPSKAVSKKKRKGKKKRIGIIDTSDQPDLANAADLPLEQDAGSVAAATHPSQIISEQDFQGASKTGSQSNASATHASQNISERDFQNAFTAGTPSNRLKLEDEAEEDRLLKELSKEDYVAYRVSLGHPALTKRLLTPTLGRKTSQEDQHRGRLLQRD